MKQIPIRTALRVDISRRIIVKTLEDIERLDFLLIDTVDRVRQSMEAVLASRDLLLRLDEPSRSN